MPQQQYYDPIILNDRKRKENNVAVGREEIVALLQEKGVSFDLAEHPPVYTIDEMLALKLPHPKDIAKNLFLRDDKKQNYYLIVLREDKKADLKKIRSVLAARPLRFASEEDLEAYLGVTTGAVTPFGLLNDRSHKVKACVDKDLKRGLVGVHPNENTATVYLQARALVELLQEQDADIDFESL
ncbi:MAG: prolyl-tRNA synthetase associated domain-containing protein [Firmicutes bacterium]|nr:prolyl-tRNA synthetase associated domain-containing protein [Bacillota bacterium]